MNTVLSYHSGCTDLAVTSHCHPNNAAECDSLKQADPDTSDSHGNTKNSKGAES